MPTEQPRAAEPSALCGCELLVCICGGIAAYKTAALVSQLVQSGGGVQVVDSREPHEHMDGHVPGSLNITHMSTLDRGDELARDTPVLFICKSGQRSAVAAEFAASLGLIDLYNVEGGHDDWADAGYPMEQ